MPVYLSEDGYSIRGIAPPDLRDRPEFALTFWGWVTALGLKAKDNELSRGLDKNGKPLRRISEATRKHRRSAMTPTGKGDPSAPPLMPGRQLSRTRSLLTGRAYPDHTAFWWKFDPWTGQSWARVLEVQADHGRDVFGLSPKAEAAVKLKAWSYWEDLKAGRPIPVIAARQAAPVAIPQVGRMPTAAAVFGIGAGGRTPGAGFSGGLTRREWEAYFRTPAKVTIPGRPGEDYNVILRHIWGAPGGPAKPVVIVPKPPKPVPIQPKPVVQRVAMPPKPQAPPKPPPPPPPPPKPVPAAWQWGQPIAPDKPIAERIKLSPAQERTKKLAEIGSAADVQEALRKVGADMMKIQADANAALARGASEEEKKKYLAGLFELQDEARRLKTLRNAIQADGQARLREIVQPPPGSKAFDWSHDIKLTTPEGQLAFREADQFLKQIMAAGTAKDHALIEWNTIPTNDEQRPYANTGKGTIYLKQQEDASQAVHEWGHHIEASVPGTLTATRDFLKHRVGNEKLRPMNELTGKSHYKATEMGREDDFRKAFGESAGYVGKDYPDGQTEVIAMGMELLYTQPGHFAKYDPEYCTFILGILDGSLRKP